MTNATTISRLLFLHAQTPVHPGTGTALDVIDLPVQRERHTRWPTVPGSSLKGILRAVCRAGSDGTDDLWLAAFGPETIDADKHAGALAVTDARVLAFPVRSLCGVFAWVTCPAVLGRLRRDVQLAGGDDGIFATVPKLGRTKPLAVAIAICWLTIQQSSWKNSNLNMSPTAPRLRHGLPMQRRTT